MNGGKWIWGCINGEELHSELQNLPSDESESANLMLIVVMLARYEASG